MFKSVKKESVGFQHCNSAGKIKQRKAFTLIELLVVVFILSVLMGILLPVMGKVRRQAKTVLVVSNQRQIVIAINYYAFDNDGMYPDSVATVGSGSNWGWQEPTMLTACRARHPMLLRSMSAYLRKYIEEASITFCPNAPEKYTYLQEAWDTGEDWDNPETFWPTDPVSGTYCFYWNYTGYLEDREFLFEGPRSSAGGPRESKLLVSCYFGYDHWRSRDAYGSCEQFRKGAVTPGTYVSSAYWSCPRADSEAERAGLNIQLRAGYMDGHVESYNPSETVPMKVSISSDGSVPYPDGIGPGIFYLPLKALD
jgi:prepilin-type N-terminal cleavage/methylation domain-containing protein